MTGCLLGAGAPAALGRSAPTCTSVSLNNSALLAGRVTVSPMPGSRDASPRTQVSFLGVPAHELRAISVVGSQSGAHAGRLLAYSQGDGASFVPNRPFAQGERVTVRASLLGGGSARRLIDSFAIAREDPITSTPEAFHAGSPSQVQGFHSRPDLHPPLVTVTASSSVLAPGDLFLAPYGGSGQAGPMIIESSGAVVWFKAFPRNESATDLRVQEYKGRPVLTWWQGDISVHGFGLGEDVIADDTYTDIARVRAGNGLQADLHEFQLTPQGTALITAYDPIYCDLSSVGGSPNGAVVDATVQQIDVGTGLVMSQWTSIDHVALGESYEQARKSNVGSPFDFFHANSIDVDRDGSLLISARNTWAFYDVDSRSGQIRWRVGGKHSTFALGPGTSMAWQHDPRELADGSISVFDNGASPAVHGQSRGIVLALDSQHRTATLLRQLTHPSPLLADSQGNLQALPNGDWLVGWGQAPYLSEFNAGGQLLFDAHLPAQDESYRSLRFPWTGAPAHLPTFAVEAGAGGAETAYASWNGATQVAAWRVLAGPTPASMSTVAQAARSGFETAMALPGAPPGPDVTVQALDATGTVIATAATLKVP